MRKRWANRVWANRVWANRVWANRDWANRGAPKFIAASVWSNQPTRIDRS